MSDLIERGNKILERPRNYSDSSLLDWIKEAILESRVCGFDYCADKENLKTLSELNINQARTIENLQAQFKELEADLNEYKDAECRAVKLHGEALKKIEEYRLEHNRNTKDIIALEATIDRLQQIESREE